jgi:aspartyl-tRNA(Asn)/glutamyl-tRNA(Gln) amidotransferase subunit A
VTPIPTIADAARAYRAGELSPVEVTDACLDRIAERDGIIRAFAEVTADRARWQARQAVTELADDPDGHRPLLGIPIGVKDIVDVAGVPTRAGTDVLGGRPATADAVVWRRLAAAGAVLVGKTATDELAYGVASPPVRNPVDTGRMPGGSSGGSAAALADGMCLGAVGTDTAGSVRIPAGLCGVAAIKPTRGWCPTDGVLALSPTLDHVGPLARNAGDLALLLTAMADRPVATDASELAGMRVGLAATDALWTPAVRSAFTGAAEALRAHGAALVELDTPSLAQARWRADRIIGVEAGVTHGDLLASSGDALSAGTRARLASAGRVDGPTYYRAVAHARAVRTEFARALGSVDVLLAPGVASTAPAYGAEHVEIDGRQRPLSHVLCHNMAAANLAGLPAVAMPTGRADDGLPVGVQLIGPADGDSRLLSVAAAVEAVVMGR